MFQTNNAYSNKLKFKQTMLISQLSDVWLKRVFAHYLTAIFGMNCSTTACSLWG